MLKLYNSLTNKKEAFKPREGKRVNMFVCGITPYDSPHIGNFRIVVNYDVLARYLRFKNYNLFYLQNVTDIDDKIIKAAQEKNMFWKDIAARYFKEYLAVSKQLGVKSVSKYAKATLHIKDIIRQIEKLINKGYAYEKNGSVYFEVKRFKDYGKLSHQNLKKLHSGARLEEDPNKKHPYDFALWKARDNQNQTLGRETSKWEPAWSAPWGKGRPGWHIEDTAISEHYFGPQYDIHGGATELKFPHHEAEIAQQESASGKKPFVKYWVHAGIVMINGEKMSKSLGNFITGKEMAEKHGPDAYRLMILSSHYRSPINYTKQLILQAKANLATLRNFTGSLKQAKKKDSGKINLAKYEQKFFRAMDDDLNTPTAIAAMFGLITEINKFRQTKPLSKETAKNILQFLKKTEIILGVSFTKPISHKIPSRILQLAREREKLRSEQKWAEADKIREQIRQKGYEIKDLKERFEITPLENQKLKIKMQNDPEQIASQFNRASNTKS